VARGAVVVLAPLLLFVAMELVLRLFGFGYPTNFFVKMEHGDTFTTNRKFGWQFMQRETATQPFPVTLPVRKEKGTLRIFILGESAAQGTPAPQFGFGRILELLLERQFPERRFEVINAAMRGINSHAVRSIARECARHEPDLFLVYMGNNEVVGLYAPDPGKFNLTAHLRLIRGVQWFRSTRLGQLLTSVVRHPSEAKPEKQDMEYFRNHRLAADDPLRMAIAENFQANLRDIVQAGRRAGAKVVVSTLGANLLDFPPLGSLHRARLSPEELTRWEAAYRDGSAAETNGVHEQAIEHYGAAAAIDDHFADLHFRLGRCYRATGDLEKARKHFAMARDWDALQFRADGKLNQIIRDMAGAAADAGVSLVDAERALADAAGESRLPGNQFFHEHVHLTFDGDYLLARTFLPAVAVALGLSAPHQTNQHSLTTRQECAEALGFTAWDELGTHAAVVRMMGNAPFLDQIDHAQHQSAAERDVAAGTRGFTPEAMQRAIGICRGAVARRPNDWQIHYTFGNLLADFGEHAAAAGELAAAVKLHPDFLPARIGLGKSLWRSGRQPDAAAEFQEILRLAPDYKPAERAWAELAYPRPAAR
jgi:tetratricopeptide (TPR) repeat protein